MQIYSIIFAQNYVKSVFMKVNMMLYGTVLEGLKYPTWIVNAGNNDTFFNSAHNLTTTKNTLVRIYPLDTAETDFITKAYAVTIGCKDEAGNQKAFSISAK